MREEKAAKRYAVAPVSASCQDDSQRSQICRQQMLQKRAHAKEVASSSEPLDLLTKTKFRDQGVQADVKPQVMKPTNGPVRNPVKKQAAPDSNERSTRYSYYRIMQQITSVLRCRILPRPSSATGPRPRPRPSPSPAATARTGLASQV